MRVIAIILLCSLLQFSLKGQTYYYKQIDTVTSDSKRLGGDASAQFITINSNGCYDSDRDGYTVGNGFLKYLKTENNIHIYYGDSYWGKAFYYFSSDYGRLNIKIESSNNTLVYERYSAPADVLTSAKIKDSSNQSLPLTPDLPINLYTPNSTSLPSTPTSTPQTKTEKVRCNMCDETGISSSPTYTSTYTGNQVYCQYCRRTMDRHVHLKCTSCGGKGYTLRRIN